MNLKVARSFRPLEPYPTFIASDDELHFVDVFSYLDMPTEEGKQLFTRPHRGWDATKHEFYDQLAVTERNWEPWLSRQESASSRLAFDFPCELGNLCPRVGHNNCSDHSWHAGWYRALLHDLSERILEMEMLGSNFDSCRFCPDEGMENRVETRAMKIEFLKPDHNALLLKPRATHFG
jgi:hypothetical protein